MNPLEDRDRVLTKLGDQQEFLAQRRDRNLIEHLIRMNHLLRTKRSNLIEAKELLSLIVEETGRKREKANR
jgi:hypothetical protein